MSARSFSSRAIFSSVFRRSAILSLAALLGATSARAVITPTIIPQAEMNKPALHEFVTGVIVTSLPGNMVTYGTGSVIAHPKVVLTCAHVSATNGQWLPAGNLRFTARHHAAAAPATGITFRGFYRYDTYSTAVRSRGSSSPDAYNWDMITGFAYTNFANGYAAGHWATGADAVLKDYNTWKKTTGYPVEKTKNFYQYRINSFLASFKQTLGAYYTLSGVTSYGGNSGGPVWAWHPASKNWYVAGVFVSSDRLSMMGVRIVDANGNALLNAAKKAAGG